MTILRVCDRCKQQWSDDDNGFPTATLIPIDVKGRLVHLCPKCHTTYTRAYKKAQDQLEAKLEQWLATGGE